MKSPLSWKWLNYISVEPSFFFYCIASTMLDFVNTNLYLQKACRINATSEPDLDTPCDEHEKGLTFVADINAYLMSVKMIVVLIGIILYSSWSDQAGKKRKFFIMLPVVGLVLQSGCQCFFSYFWHVAPIYAAITSAIFEMIFGNFPTIHLFCCMYLADVVDTRNRTMRMGFLTSTKMLGFLLSKGISGYLLHSLGFLKCYSICFVLGCFILILAYVLIEDIALPLKRDVSWWSIFNLCRVCESCKIILGKKSMKHKITVLLLCFIFSLLLFIHIGMDLKFLVLLLGRNYNDLV